MKRSTILSALAPVLVSALIACGGAAAPPAATPASGGTTTAAAGTPAQADDPAATEEQDDASLDVQEQHRHHSHGGIAGFIAMSLDGLNVSDDQRETITKIQHDMHDKLRASRDAEKALLLAVADGVAAGTVDRAKLDDNIARVGAESAKLHDAVADSLNALHTALTPPQRQALVDKVEAHLGVWHRENEGKGRHLAQLAADFGLSADQVDKIRTAYQASNDKAPRYDNSEAENHVKAFGDAFVKDQFDAHALTTGGAVNAHMATWGMIRTVNLYTAAAPVLTPEQRAKVADSIRRHANYKRSDSDS
jgi:Spy/CpxP family protein refolding chaperone|nr:Spy/CpxP family protein refolding chaperone [Kofleriaceae bacterium]